MNHEPIGPMEALNRLCGFHQYCLDTPRHLCYVNQNLCDLLGASEAELRRSETVNNKGYGVRLTPIRAADVYAPFAVELFKEGAPAVRTKACAYESASDDPVFRGGYIFTTRF